MVRREQEGWRNGCDQNALYTHRNLLKNKLIKYKNFCKGKEFLINHEENGLIEGTNRFFKYPILADE